MSAATQALRAGEAPRSGRVTQLRVIASEWTKLRSLRSTMWSLLAAVLFMACLGVIVGAIQVAHWSHLDPHDRTSYDPVQTALVGALLAQLALGVLGVLVITGEYATGMIRSSFAAVPRRLPVLWAKALVFCSVAFVLMLACSLIAFFSTQAVISSKHVQTTFSAPGVARAVVGAALFLTVVGLLGVALGALLRNTAGGISAFAGIMFVVPGVTAILPSSWSNTISPYLPNNAGSAVMSWHTSSGTLHPWPGFLLFLAYALVALLVAAVLLVRRDA